MAVWAPGMAWPSPTAGGAISPDWGGYVRLWVRAGIAPGLPLHLGPHTNDNLNGGYVLGPAADDAGGGFLGDRLWIDLSCDVLSVEIAGGAGSGEGIFTTVDAATTTVKIADPTGIYDPLWTGGPFAIAGRSRLIPSVPVEVFAEVVDGDDGTWQRFPMFTGTADVWSQDWTPRPEGRETSLIASDQTKIWTRYNAPEQPAIGAGETVTQRIHRIVSFFAWPGVVIDPPGGSTRTLAATTLAQSGWELLNRTTGDELGAIHFTPAGALRWINREALTTITPPKISLGCERVDSGAADVLVDATPAKVDLALRNDVYAGIPGATEQRAFSQASIDRYGPYGYKRSDLGLADSIQAAAWAAFVVEMCAFPQVGIEDVTMLPAIAPRSWEIWATVLGWVLFTDVARIIWAPPDLPEHVIDGLTRVVGVKHTIDRHRWSVTWQTIAASPIDAAGTVFVLGPSATDHLDQGYVLA